MYEDKEKDEEESEVAEDDYHIYLKKLVTDFHITFNDPSHRSRRKSELEHGGNRILPAKSSKPKKSVPHLDMKWIFYLLANQQFSLAVSIDVMCISRFY